MRKKLLLVDDDAVERSWVEDALAGIDDLQVDVAHDGQEAVDYLRRHGPNTPEAPTVVFLDLGLPRLNGFEVLRELHRLAHAHRVPVVVFSVSTAHADVYLSYQFGANAFVVKPSEPGQLQKVARLAAEFWLHSNVLPPAA